VIELAPVGRAALWRRNGGSSDSPPTVDMCPRAQRERGALMMIDESRRGQSVRACRSLQTVKTFVSKGMYGTLLYEIENGLEQKMLCVRWGDSSIGLVFPSDIEDVNTTDQPGHPPARARSPGGDVPD
jgi:hypothetical protein